MQNKTKSGLNAHFLFYLLRSDKVISIVVFLFSLFIYEFQAPSRLSSANFGSDGGDYLTAVLTGGIPHPTGYPFYLLVSSLFQFIPFGTPVWKQAQVSIFAASLAAGLFCYLCLILPSNLSRAKIILSSLLVALSLAFSQLFWSQAVIIEVYALNALWLIFALLWIDRYSTQHPGLSDWKMFTFSVICGLGIANHTTFILLYPLIANILFNKSRTNKNHTWILLSAIGWFSGLLLYTILPIRAGSEPPIAWGNPSTLSGFLWLLSGGGYGDNLFGIQPIEYLQRIFATLKVFIVQLGWIGTGIAILGIYQSTAHSKYKWATIYLVIVYSVFSIGYKTNDSLVYLIPAIVCMFLWLKWGLDYLFTIRISPFQVGYLVSIVLASSLILTFPSTFRTIDPRSGDLADFAEATLQTAKKGETIYPQTDGETFALWYYHYGLKWRPDVRIISPGLEQYDWYRNTLKKLYPDYIAE